MKIFIAVPTFESIAPDTFKSIYDLDPAGCDLSFAYVRGYDCATARNRIVQKAMDAEADYVLMVDSDMVLPSDTLTQMLEDQKDVCLGIYPKRERDTVYSGRMCVYKPGEFNYNTMFNISEIARRRQGGEKKMIIHGGGMGCALIKTDVFRRLKYPWYKWVNYNNGSVLSEDLYFCEECRKAGIMIWADIRVECGHIFRHVQWPVAE